VVSTANGGVPQNAENGVVSPPLSAVFRHDEKNRIKSFKPLKIVHTESYELKTEVLKIENQIKSNPINVRLYIKL
jgi:predicted GIY-YIG superfamily endonuclease